MTTFRRPVVTGFCITVIMGLWLSLFLRPIHDVDIFWQMKLGELAIDRGAMVVSEPFLGPRLGEPLVPVAWLGQIADAAIFRWGGWETLRVADALIWFGGLVVAARDRWKTITAKTLALTIGFLAAVPFHSIRPQSFAILCFGMLVHLTHGNLPARRKLIVGIPLLVAWQNLHPSVIVGAVYLASVTLTGLVLAIFRRTPKPWTTAILMVAAGLAVVATPAGLQLLAVSRANAELSTWMRTAEWLPIWAAENRLSGLGPALAMVLMCYLAVRNRSRVEWIEVIPALVFAAMTCYAIRFAVFYAVVLIPFLASLLNDRVKWLNQATDPPPRGLKIYTLVLAVSAGLVVPILPLRFADYYPFAGIDALKTANVSGTVYCHQAWGSLLPFYGHPDWHPTHDGRHYLHTKGEWERFFLAARGEGSVAELVNEHHPTAFFLRPGFDDGLIKKLNSEPGWQKQFEDSRSILFLPRP